MQITSGNLITQGLEGKYDIIVHGCNCHCTMGAGIALEIKNRIPEAFAVDRKTISGDVTKLGTYTSTIIQSPVSGKLLQVVNAYTQYDFNSYGASRDLFQYAAFDRILTKLATEYPSANYGFPAIGMDRAGGSKTKIMAQLEKFANIIESTGGSVTFVVFDNTK